MSDWTRVSSGAVVFQNRGVGFTATHPRVAERDLWTTRVCDRVFVPLGLGGFSPANTGIVEAGGIEPPSDLPSLHVSRDIKPRTHLVTAENDVERIGP